MRLATLPPSTRHFPPASGQSYRRQKKDATVKPWHDEFCQASTRSFNCCMMVSAPETLTPFSVSTLSVFTTPSSTIME